MQLVPEERHSTAIDAWTYIFLSEVLKLFKSETLEIVFRAFLEWDAYTAKYDERSAVDGFFMCFA